MDTLELDELVMAKLSGKSITKNKEVVKVIRKVTDTFNRKSLNEGRNFGLGFSILEKTDSEYKALCAFTACKDYLNDFIYVEGTGLKLGNAYGFTHTYTGKLKNQDYFYTGFRPVHYNNGNKYIDFDKLGSILKGNQNNIIKFLSKLEKEFGLDKFSEVEDCIDDVLIIKTPAFWSKFSFIYSLYGLLIRCFVDVTAEELNKDINTLIKERKTTFIQGDISLLNSISKHFPIDLTKLLNHTYPINPDPYTIHNGGIVARLQHMK